MKYFRGQLLGTGSGFLGNESLSNGAALKEFASCGSKFFSLRVAHYEKGDKSFYARVASLGSVSSFIIEGYHRNRKKST